MRYLSIKNYAKHQHYKDRRPPWIKLHVEVLDDYSFICLQDASKAHLMLLWVLASKMDNRIPYDLPFLSRKLGTTSPIDVEELVLQGFIEVTQDDGKTLAPRKQSAMPETEAERETEAEAEGARAPRRLRAIRPPRPATSAWVSEGVAWWAQSVGDLKPATFDKTLAAMVALHGWPAVFADLQKWVAARKAVGKAINLTWYAQEASARITAPPPPPLVDENGCLTAYGERMSRPDKVPA